MTSPLPLCFATATQWYEGMPEQWQAIQNLQQDRKNYHKTMRAGIVEIKSIYYVADNGIGTLGIEYIWETSRKDTFNFYAHYAPANQSRAEVTLVISGWDQHPIPNLILQESLPGRKLSELIELPPEISGIGDYVIKGYDDIPLTQNFIVDLHP